MAGYSFKQEKINLPGGAWAKTKRRLLKRGRQALAGFTQGDLRPYLYPVHTPSGHVVTAEGPADHPHHNSVWIAADHVHFRHPSEDGPPDLYTYNFYVNETFQGRTPGNIQETSITGKEIARGRYRVQQSLDWTGPREWAAAEGRLILTERRTVDVWTEGDSNIIDVKSSLTPKFGDLELGPTRHAIFNVRMAECMKATAVLSDSKGIAGTDPIIGFGAKWIDYSGEASPGHRAGDAVFPHPKTSNGWWYAADWGVLTIDPFRKTTRIVKRGQKLDLQYRIIVHDGDATEAGVKDHYRTFLKDIGRKR